MIFDLQLPFYTHLEKFENKIEKQFDTFFQDREVVIQDREVVK